MPGFVEADAFTRRDSPMTATIGFSFSLVRLIRLASYFSPPPLLPLSMCVNIYTYIVIARHSLVL